MREAYLDNLIWTIPASKDNETSITVKINNRDKILNRNVMLLLCTDEHTFNLLSNNQISID